MEKTTSLETAEIAFELADGTQSPFQLRGAAADLVEAPEKIHALMDLLDLPKGSSARVTVTSSTVIVR